MQLKADVHQFHPVEPADLVQVGPGGLIGTAINLVPQRAAGYPGGVDDPDRVEVGLMPGAARKAPPYGVESQQALDHDGEARLLRRLANRGVKGILAVLYSAAGQRPQLP